MRDVRHDALAELGFDLNRCAIPWMHFWTMNCSIRADDFWAVGGFGEEFNGWGLEDMEFAFRAHRHGIPFQFSQQAWVVHAPHERDWPAQLKELAVNMARFLRRHPEPVAEIGWTLITRYQLVWPWEQEYLALSRAAKQAPADVADEIGTVLASHDAESGSRSSVLVRGCRTRPRPRTSSTTITSCSARPFARPGGPAAAITRLACGPRLRTSASTLWSSPPGSPRYGSGGARTSWLRPSASAGPSASWPPDRAYGTPSRPGS